MDIKTTAKLWHFEDSMKEFDYCRQLCFYKDAVYWYLANVLGITDEFDKWRFEFYIIAIDTTGSNEIRVFRLDSSQVCSRNDVINDTMTEIAWHMDKNLWEHGYEYYAGDGSETLNL